MLLYYHKNTWRDSGDPAIFSAACLSARLALISPSATITFVYKILTILVALGQCLTKTKTKTNIMKTLMKISH